MSKHPTNCGCGNFTRARTRRELLQSVRGARGGYRLARPPERISIADVIEALEGPFGMTECSVVEGLCAQEGNCPIRANWQQVNQLIRQRLAQVTLADMSSSPVQIQRARTGVQ